MERYLPSWVGLSIWLLLASGLHSLNPPYLLGIVGVTAASSDFRVSLPQGSRLQRSGLVTYSERWKGQIVRCGDTYHATRQPESIAQPPPHQASDSLESSLSSPPHERTGVVSAVSPIAATAVSSMPFGGSAPSTPEDDQQSTKSAEPLASKRWAFVAYATLLLLSDKSWYDIPLGIVGVPLGIAGMVPTTEPPPRPMKKC
jgi:hypothetical protein